MIVGESMTVEQMRIGVADWLASEAPSLTEFRGHHAEPVEDRWVRDGRLMARMYEAGWNRYGWPKRFGGLGGPEIMCNVLLDELEFAGYPVPEHYTMLAVQGPAIMRFAPHLAERIMPDALRGNEMWAQGFSEPEAGSDLASLRCKAERTDDRWVINGQKTWSSYGPAARWMGVLARTGAPDSRHRGLTLILVDLHSPGVEVRPIKLASGANEFAEVFFDNVTAPLEHVIGEVHGGWAVAMYLLQFERANYAWMRQARIAHRLGDLAHEIPDPTTQAAKTLGECWLSNLALRTRSGATVQSLFGGAPIGPAASIDKILLAQSEQSMNDAHRDLLPDRFLFGDDDESEVWRGDWYYSRAASIYGGAGEIQRGIIADRLLALPKEA